MKLIALEGNTQKLDGGAMFGNAPRPMWEKWSEPDAQNRILLACRSLLLCTDEGKNILFEAGIGAFFEPQLKERFGVVEARHVLLDSLAAVGLAHSDIDAVVLSHLHFDHAGGLLSEYVEGQTPHLLFSKARFYVSQKHWQRALDPHSRDRASFLPDLNAQLEKSGRLVLVSDHLNESQHTDLAPLVTFHFSDGHTPGLMLAQLNLPSGPLVFAADLIPGMAWVHVPLSMGYDRFPELVIDEKKALLTELLKANGKLFFTHDERIPCGKIVCDTKGKFSAEPVSLDLL